MKKNVLPILLLLVLCLTLACSTALADGDCNHASASTTGYCATCQHQFALKINKNSTDHYYDALDLNVYSNVLAGGTATLFRDVTYEYNSRNVLEFEITSTIDLNGHSFHCQDQNGNDVRVKVRAGGNLTLCDSGTGEKGTFLPELYATSIEGSKGTVTLKDGVKVSKLFAENDGVLNVEDAVVGTLKVSGSKCAVKLSGGTYDKIDGNPGSLLAEGHAYADKTSGTLVKLGSASTNLKVVSHTCSAEDGKNDTGKCDYCGAQRYVAKVDSTWYNDLDTAFHDACDNTVTILAYLTYGDNYSVPSTCTLDLNGHKIAGTVSLEGFQSTISIIIQGEQAGSELGTLYAGTHTAIVESGTVGTLKFSSQATFSGGSFGNISTRSMRASLAEGCAFQKTTGDKEMVKLSDIVNNKLENVAVVKCAHSSLTGGVCDTCGGLIYLDDKGSAAFYLGKNYSTIESDQSGAVTLNAGWYAVTKPAIINGNLTFSGQVHLVLCDGATLTVNGMAITDSNAASLTLYSQSTGENMGQLSVTGASSGDGGYVGINNNGSLTIHGGAVRATGSK